MNNTDWLAILDEMDDPTQEELDAALEPVFIRFCIERADRRLELV